MIHAHDRAGPRGHANRTASPSLGRRGMLAACAALVIALPTGCGWHTGLVAPDGAESIGVTYFDVEEDVLQRDLSPELQAALTQATTDLVGLRLYAPERSDLVITGRIVDYGRRGGIRSKDHALLETAVRLTVEARLTRRSTGTVLSTARASVPSGYVTADRVVDPGTGDVTNVVGGTQEERRARARSLRILAEGLILDLFAPLQAHAEKGPHTPR